MPNIKDNSSLHKYRTEIPNILDELNLDPYEFRLYFHFKRVAGDSGSCYQSNNTIAEKTGMGVTSVKEKRKSLAQPRPELDGKSLITITERKKENGEPLPTLIEINDIWEDNFKIMIGRFSSNRGVGCQKTEGQLPNGCKEEPLQEEPKQQQVAAVFPDSLKNLGIPEEEKKWIEKEYSHEDINHAIAYATHPEVVIETTLVQVVKWACKAKPDLPKSKTESVQENKSYAEKFRRAKSDNSVIEILSNHVEIFQKNSPMVICLEYSEKGFKEKLIESLEKFKFDVTQIDK